MPLIIQLTLKIKYLLFTHMIEQIRARKNIGGPPPKEASKPLPHCIALFKSISQNRVFFITLKNKTLILYPHDSANKSKKKHRGSSPKRGIKTAPTLHRTFKSAPQNRGNFFEGAFLTRVAIGLATLPDTFLH